MKLSQYSSIKIITVNGNTCEGRNLPQNFQFILAVTTRKQMKSIVMHLPPSFVDGQIWV